MVRADADTFTAFNAAGHQDFCFPVPDADGLGGAALDTVGATRTPFLIEEDGTTSLFHKHHPS
jgi:hypothetical protein